ncbi:MAG: hypothetical protein AB7G28_11710 [Pirellulales bacterium]
MLQIIRATLWESWRLCAGQVKQLRPIGRKRSQALKGLERQGMSLALADDPLVAREPQI